jgi:recombination protein RecT
MTTAKSGGALARPEDRTRAIMRTVGQQLDRKSKILQAMLPREVTPERLKAFSLLAMQRTPRLQECGVPSLLAAVYEAARAGLDPDAIDAVILPYRGEAQFQLMFRGAMKLARRAGGVVQIWADTVRERDLFVEARGSAPSIEHSIPRGEDGRPLSESERGDLIAAYACARFRDGYVQHHVVLADEIERAKRSSRSASRADSPWNTHEAAMWTKTAVLRLCKFLPLPDEAKRAAALDDLAEAGVDQRLGAEWSALPDDTGAEVTDARPLEVDTDRRPDDVDVDGLARDVFGIDDDPR